MRILQDCTVGMWWLPMASSAGIASTTHRTVVDLIPQQFSTGVFLDDWGGSWWWTIGVETVLVVPSVISPTTIVDNCGIVDHLSTIRGGQDKYSFGQLSYIHLTTR